MADDDEYVEGDAHSAPADPPGTVPMEDAAKPVAAAEPVFDSLSTADLPVQQLRGRNTSRTQSARKAFAEKILEAKKQTAETAAPAKAAAAEPDPEEDESEQVVVEKPAEIAAPEIPRPAVAATPPAPSLDPEVVKLRQQLAADREEQTRQHEAKMAELAERERAAHPTDLADELESYVDNNGKWLRSRLETMRGEKLSDEDFRAEAADFVSQLSADVLGVPLPEPVQTKLVANQARKIVSASKAVAARRAAEEAKRAEAERTKASARAQDEEIERQWSSAANMLTKGFVPGQKMDGVEAAKEYQWLAAEDEPGKIVVDVIRASLKKDGTQLSWQEASKRANDYLKGQWEGAYGKRKALLGAQPAAPEAAKPAPAKPVTPAAKPAAPPTIEPRVAAQPSSLPVVSLKRPKDGHLERSRQAFRDMMKATSE